MTFVKYVRFTQEVPHTNFFQVVKKKGSTLRIIQFCWELHNTKVMIFVSILDLALRTFLELTFTTFEKFVKFAYNINQDDVVSLSEAVAWRCLVTKLFSIEHLRTVAFANFDQSSTSCNYGDPRRVWEKVVLEIWKRFLSFLRLAVNVLRSS